MSDVALSDDFEDLGEAPFADDEPAGEPEITIEQRAGTMGWKPLPKDPRNPESWEYRGDPRRWTDAETFVQHGLDTLPVLRDQNHRLTEKVARTDMELTTLRTTVSEQTQAVKDAMALARRADEAGYQRGLAELKARQREAVATGDTEVFDQVQAQIDAAQREREATVDEAPPAPRASTPEPEWPETTAFKAANPWLSDPTLLTAMVNAHNYVISAHPSLARAAQYERAKQQVVTDFPDRFPEEPMAREPIAEPAPRQRPRAPVLTPSAAAPRAPRGASPFEQIEDPAERAEARAAFDRVRNWDPNTTAEEYVSLYLNPKQNPLELRAQRSKK